MISDVTHVSLSQLADNFFVVHVPAEYDYLYVSRCVRLSVCLSVNTLIHTSP